MTANSNFFHFLRGYLLSLIQCLSLRIVSADRFLISDLSNLFAWFFLCILFIVSNVNFNVVYCMEKEDLGQIMQVCAVINNINYSPEEIQALLARVNSIQDPEILGLLRQRISIIAGIYNVDINTFLIPQLQHILQGIILAGTLTLLGYLLVRNWSTLRDVLFDVTQRSVESISPIGLELTQQQLEVLVNNPASQQAVITALLELLGNPVLPA